MGKRRNVAIIGISSLEAIALRELLKHHPGITSEAFSCFSHFFPLSSRFDAFITEAHTFLLNPVFFMPRKKNTMIVFRTERERGMVYKDMIAGKETKHIRIEDRDCNFSEIPASVFMDSDEIEIESSLSKILNDSVSDIIPSAELSSREKEVLRLIAKGHQNKEIADILCISVNTAITHRKNISNKLGIKSASALSLYALMQGLI